MTRRTAIGTLCLVLLLGAAPRAARASVADAFENKIPPVSGQLYGKAGRFEITPTFQLSLNDAFFSKYMGGLKLGYHFSDAFYAGAFGTFGTTSVTGSATRCAPGAGCTPADPSQLYQVPGLIHWIAGAEVAFSPVYGKLNVFAEKAVHFDLSLIVGADVVSYREAWNAVSSIEPATASSLGGHVGLGARVFFGGFMAVRLEIKELLYSATFRSPPSDPNPTTSSSLQQQLLADIGLSFFLPTTTRTP